MVTDLNYKPVAGQQRLSLTGKQDVPDILKEAITLMLFSQDPDIRNFNGSSIVNAFPSIPESGIGGISFYLSVAASRIKQILQSRHNTVSNVYFDTTGTGSKLSVTLNVVTENDTNTIVVWE